MENSLENTAATVTSTTNYAEARKSGVPVLRRSWVNRKNPNQITLQFQQIIEKPSEGTENELVAMSQEIEGIGQNIISALMSVKKTFAEKKGIPEEYDYTVNPEGREILTSDAIYGTKTEVEVIENTVKNPKAPKQQPKINPQTKEVLMFDAKPIYRHTRLVKAPATRVFLDHNQSVNTASGVVTEVQGRTSAQNI